MGPIKTSTTYYNRTLEEHKAPFYRKVTCKDSLSLLVLLNKALQLYLPLGIKANLGETIADV